MCCTKRQAVRRLICRWLYELQRNPDTASNLPLAKVLCAENIAAVVDDDFAERQRGNEMVRHWLAPRQIGRAIQ
jgi:hypothetical protein